MSTTDGSGVIRLVEAQAGIPESANKRSVRVLQRGTLDAVLGTPARPKTSAMTSSCDGSSTEPKAARCHYTAQAAAEGRFRNVPRQRWTHHEGPRETAQEAQQASGPGASGMVVRREKRFWRTRAKTVSFR
jgi:hypothetical protein